MIFSPTFSPLPPLFPPSLLLSPPSSLPSFPPPLLPSPLPYSPPLFPRTSPLPLLFLFFSQLIDINEGFLSLMDDNGEVRDDIRLPDSDLGKEIQSKFDAGDQLLVTVISAMAEEAAIQIKNMPK